MIEIGEDDEQTRKLMRWYKNRIHKQMEHEEKFGHYSKIYNPNPPRVMGKIRSYNCGFICLNCGEDIGHTPSSWYCDECRRKKR